MRTSPTPVSQVRRERPLAGAAHAGAGSETAAIAAAFDAAREATLIVDDDCVCVAANRAAARLAVYAEGADPLVGRRLDQLLEPALGAPFDARWAAFLLAGEVHREYEAVLSDGGRSQLEFEATARVAPARHLVTFRVVGDLPDAKARAGYPTSVFADSEDGFVCCSLDGLVVAWNSGAEQIYGYAADEAVGRHCSFLIPSDEHEAREAEWGELIKGQRLKRVEMRCVTKAGREIVVSSTVSPITNARGEIAGVLSITRDITSQRASEIALAAAHAKAVEATRLRSEFIANMNHELRTPLSGVIGILSLLADTSLDPEQQTYIDALRTSSDALLAVIHGVLDFSKIESGNLTLVLEPFDFRQLVLDVRSVVAGGSPASAVELTASVDSDLPEQLLGDRDRIRQVLLNLIGNAMKFTETGVVEIQASWNADVPHDGQLRVEVADTGIGIDESAQELIFKSFAQADGSTTRRYGGTGLGLAIAKELVEMMGGNIGVHSTPGAGSTFWFTLPLDEAPKSARRDSLPSLDGARVLVAHAGLMWSRVLAGRLRDWDVTVALAHDSDEALDELRTAELAGQPFDVVLLAHDLPGTTAREVSRTISSDDALSAVRVIGILPAGTPPDDAHAADFAGVVKEPMLETDLHREIVRVIDESSWRP